jgi:hypothetical protein
LLERWRQLERDRFAVLKDLDEQRSDVEVRIRDLGDSAPDEVQAFVREFFEGVFKPGSHWVEDLTEYLTKEAGRGQHREEI